MADTEESSCHDVIQFLKRNNLDDLIEEFQGMLHTIMFYIQCCYIHFLETKQPVCVRYKRVLAILSRLSLCAMAPANTRL